MKNAESRKIPGLFYRCLADLMRLERDPDYTRCFHESNISQRGLASLCTIDHSDISKIEKGERNVTLLTVLELATALEVKPKKLLDFDVD
jgi:DNA-binding Xre family transcriptional regulator